MTVAFRMILSMLTMLYAFVAMGSCAVSREAAPAELTRADIPLEEPEGRTLTILNSRPEISKALQEAADLYLDGLQEEDISIRVQTIGNQSSYQATLRARMGAGEQVDLFHIFGRRDALETEAHIEDLSSLEWAREALPFTLEPVTLEGVLYGIPYSVEGVGLLANKEIFDAAQLPIGEMATLDGMEKTFKELREKITLGELKEEFPALEAVTELPAQDYAFAGGQLADIALAGEFISAAQATASRSIVFARDEEMGRYVDLTARYATNGRGWQSLANVSGRLQVEEGLAAGRVAVIQQSTAVYERICEVDPELGRVLRLLPIPMESGDTADVGVVLAEVPAYWAVNRNSSAESKALALDFLTWLYRSETGATLYASRFHAVSPYQETALESDAPIRRQLLGYIREGMYIPRYYREFPADWAYRGFAEAIRDYLTIPEYAWAEAVEEIKRSWPESR